jgi:protein-L-isoaspartate O-methyltransferase
MARPSIYSRPVKPLYLVGKRRNDFDKPAAVPMVEPAMVDRATECHVTPPDVARRMVDYLAPEPHHTTLEPSAGTGNLVAALVQYGVAEKDISKVERHVTLAVLLAEKYSRVSNQCFLDYAAERAGKVFYDRVIMNPPFSDVRKHVAAALSLLWPSRGVLVALVPITFQHPEDEHLETLPPDTFSTARVNTKLIRIEKGV